MAIRCCVGSQVGAAQFSPKAFSSALSGTPLAAGESSAKAQTAMDNLWVTPVTTSSAGGAVSALHAGQRDTAASPKVFCGSALVAGAQREGKGTEGGIAEISTLICLCLGRAERWIDTGRVSDIRECCLERSVSRALTDRRAAFHGYLCRGTVPLPWRAHLVC